MNDSCPNRLEVFLLDEIAKVNRQRHLLEIECRLLKDLLKPWPQKKTAAKEEDSNQVIQPAAVNNPESDSQTADLDKLSPGDKKVLSEVDDILRKAEKAFYLKSKKQVKVESTNTSGPGVTQAGSHTPENYQLSEGSVVTSSKPQSKSVAGFSQIDVVGSSTSTDFFRMDCDNNRNNQEILEAGHTPQSLNSASAKFVNSQKSRNSLSSLKETKTMKHSNTNNKPITCNQHAKTKAVHIPTYRLAALKTSHKIGHAEKTKCRIRPVSSSTGVSVKTSNQKTLPAIETLKKGRLVSDPCPPKAQYDFTPIGSISNDPKLIQTSQVNKDDLSDQNLSLQQLAISQDSSHNSVPCSKIAEDDSRKGVQNTLLSGSTDPGDCYSVPELFTLQKHGSDLKPPGRLVKLVHVNNSLRDKLSSAQKSDSINPAEHFVSRLNEQEISPALKARVCILNCWKSHQVMLDMLHELHLDELTEKTSTQVLYRTKLVLERVMTRFTDLQQTADNLSSVFFQPVPLVENKREAQNQQDNSVWLGDNDKQAFKQDLVDFCQASRKWSHLKFTQKYLDTYLSLVRLAESEWGNTLNSPDRNLTVLQGIYSLLTSQGKFVPTFVEKPE